MSPTNNESSKNKASQVDKAPAKKNKTSESKKAKLNSHAKSHQNTTKTLIDTAIAPSLSAEVLKHQHLIQSLIEARCSDPFGALGPYAFYPEVGIRAWLPGAHDVNLIDAQGKAFPLLGDGLGSFEWQEKYQDPKSKKTCSKTQSPDFSLYQFDVNWGDHRTTLHDPYQFHNIAPSEMALKNPNTLYDLMGARLHSIEHNGNTISGVRYLVFAPNAQSVSVIGSFNQWNGTCHPLQRFDHGIWGVFIPNMHVGEQYKFEIKNSAGTTLPHKADPFGLEAQGYPSHTSVVYDHSQYRWQDDKWQDRPVTEKRNQPLSMYELHIGSWMRTPDGQFLTYRQLADKLIPYLQSMRYTHIELMPVSEHPFYGSWGYQPIGLFAPTSRYGTPDEFKYFVDQCHQANIGVIIDWVPAHFPSDEHGLAYFDGSPLFHDPDPRRGWHQDWNSFIYDYSKEHVRLFLISNALYWFEHFHIDGLRVDAVASMIYLDYSREHNEWIPNKDGGNHNYEAISLLRWMNEEIYQHYPNAITIAEESTAFTGVSQPTYLNGLGFGFKWNMGWMHDSLSYISQEPIHRQYHHNTLTFPLIYAFSENYVLSLSHDEVVHGKGAIIDKMPGDDEWQQTANLRAYYGYMYGQPGKKLNFMGGEFGQTCEWNHECALSWWLLDHARHQGVQKLVGDLNTLYCDTPALYEQDCIDQGFAWRIQDDYLQSVIAHERYAKNGDKVLVISNFTPVARTQYEIGVPEYGQYELLLNTDDNKYWGSHFPTESIIKTTAKLNHGYPYSINVDLPPLSTLFLVFKKEG